MEADELEDLETIGHKFEPILIPFWTNVGTIFRPSQDLTVDTQNRDKNGTENGSSKQSRTFWSKAKVL